MSSVTSEFELVSRKAALRLKATPLCFAAFVSLAVVTSCAAETLPDALVKAYQSNPQLNADRARQRGTDENVPQALAGYRSLLEREPFPKTLSRRIRKSSREA